MRKIEVPRCSRSTALFQTRYWDVYQYYTATSSAYRRHSAASKSLRRVSLSLLLRWRHDMARASRFFDDWKRFRNFLRGRSIEAAWHFSGHLRCCYGYEMIYTCTISIAGALFFTPPHLLDSMIISRRSCHASRLHDRWDILMFKNDRRASVKSYRDFWLKLVKDAADILIPAASLSCFTGPAKFPFIRFYWICHARYYIIDDI